MIGKPTQGLTPELFIAECVCGAQIKSETRDTKCTECNRLIRFDWGLIEVENQPPVKTITENYL